MSDNFYSGMRGPVAIAKLNDLWLQTLNVGPDQAAAAAAASASAASASSSAQSAQASQTTATNSANSAQASATSASQSATQATSSANSATASAGQASASLTSANNSATSASQSATQATNSANSATASAGSATASSGSASASLTSANNSATQAAASLTSANNSATSASQQATQATSSANSATASAGSATASAGQASASATSETNAAASATAALSSKNSAIVSETNAAAQETNAAVSETNALASESLAQQWAIKTDGPVSTGEYSAKYWANYVTTTLSGQLQYKGAWDASVGTYPTSPVLGDYWRVSVGGTISSVVYTVNDQLVYNGTTWDKFDSVAGEGIAVTLEGHITGTGVTGGVITTTLATQQKIDFNTSTPAASAVGRVTWNTGDGTLDLGLLGGNVVLQVGQEQVQRVYNNTGASLPEGRVVYITGAQGTRLTVSLASNTSEATSSKSFGVLTESIADAAEGYICTEGLVRNIDTSAYAEGAALWLNSSNGNVTTTKPTAPAHSVLVGYCIRSHASAGSIFVKVQNGQELDELHDVLVVTPQNGDIMIYEDGLWKNKTPAQARSILDVYSKTETESLALSMAIALG